MVDDYLVDLDVGVSYLIGKIKVNLLIVENFLQLMFLFKKMLVDFSRFILFEQDRINLKEYLVVFNGRFGFIFRSKFERY